ncbi:ABC transporter substrate-binding protein, partial [Salmonella enterica subsp. enterica serovar Kentucky]|nr:ABC transporter substrate-binding protein [Salmonella enterica subsp. enterica serovar Kentucky]
ANNLYSPLVKNYLSFIYNSKLLKTAPASWQDLLDGKFKNKLQATRFLEYTPHDFAAWNRTLLTEVFPYLKDVKIDFAWGGPMAC